MKEQRVLIKYIPNTGKTKEAQHYNYLATLRHCDCLVTINEIEYMATITFWNRWNNSQKLKSLKEVAL